MSIRKAITFLGLILTLAGISLNLYAITPAISSSDHYTSSPAPVSTHPSTHTHAIRNLTKSSQAPPLQGGVPWTQKERIAEHFVNIGLDKLHQNNVKGAIKDFNQALQLNPNHDSAYVIRAEVRRQLNDNQGAVADYTQALQTNPNFTYIYNSRGKAFEALADYQAAIKDYTQAIELYPEDGIGYSNRGAARFKIGDAQGAIADLDRAIIYNSGNALAYTHRGDVLANIGNNTDAIADYTQAASLFLAQGNSAGYAQVTSLITQLQQPATSVASIP